MAFLEFLADEVSCSDEDNVITVGFYQSVPPNHYIMFQRDTKENFVSRIYVERDDQRWSAYDAIKSFVLTRSDAILVLNEKGMELIGLEGVRISIPEFEGRECELTTILGQLFDNTNFFSKKV